MVRGCGHEVGFHAAVAAAGVGRPGMTAVKGRPDGAAWKGTVKVVLVAEAPRVNCPAHGPTVVAVPWARHHAGHTLAFDDTVDLAGGGHVRKPRCAN